MSEHKSTIRFSCLESLLNVFERFIKTRLANDCGGGGEALGFPLGFRTVEELFGFGGSGAADILLLSADIFKITFSSLDSSETEVPVTLHGVGVVILL